jgi:hypothetical protein
MLFRTNDFFVFFQHVVEGKKERAGDLVPHRQGLEAGEPRIFQGVDLSPAVARDEDAAVFVDDAPVSRMLVHYIDADPFLLVPIYVMAVGNGDKPVEIIV